VVIQPGDNLFRIGLKYGCTVEQIARHNGITTPNRVAVGLEIEIPDCN
jgi:LysM repeat protein